MPLHFPNHIRIAVARTNMSRDYINEVENEDGTKFYTDDAFLIKLLSYTLHFSFTIVPSEDNAYGEMLEDGNWSGVFGKLQQEQADLGVSRLSIRYDRCQVVDFSHPYDITDTPFLTHNPEPMGKDLAIFYPFEYRIWIAFVPFFLVVCLLFYAMERRNRSFQYIFLRVFGSVLEKELSLNQQSWLERSFLFFWISSVMFLSYSYKGLILTFLTFPPMKSVSNIAELANAVIDGSHACFTFRGSYLTARLMESSDPDVKTVAECLLKNKDIDLDIEKLIKIKEPKSVLIASRSALRVYRHKLYLSDDSFSTSMLAVAVRKTFCCKTKLDEIIRRINEADLYEKFLRDNDLVKSFGFSVPLLDYAETRALRIEDLYGALWLYISGQILALIVFSLEYLIPRSMRLRFRCSAGNRA